MKNLTPAELHTWLRDTDRGKPLLLDVREPWEFRTCRIADSTLMPMASVPSRLVELDPGTPTVVICHHGARSMQVAHFLARRGFSEVYNLAGGVNGWARSVDPAMPVY
jgi:rhodanese-related sulfurtransferase